MFPVPKMRHVSAQCRELGRSEAPTAATYHSLRLKLIACSSARLRSGPASVCLVLRLACVACASCHVSGQPVAANELGGSE